MKALVLKELKTIFSSPVGAFFALAFLLLSGLVLWLFSGNYNFIDNGYADMGRFFWLSSILLLVFIPALTMRLFSEEKQSGTFDVLISRPISRWQIYFSKFISTYIFVITVLATTSIYVYSLYLLAYPQGNLDLGSITASYISLMLLAAVFISIGLLGSVITQSQIVAFIVSLFISLFAFYGFDLLSTCFASGSIQLFISSLGLSFHYESMQRGVVQLGDILAIVNYLAVFIFLSLVFLRYTSRILIVFIFLISILNVVFLIIPNTRFDFTSDKRYTLNDYTISLLKSINEDLKIEILVFLNGDLNHGFQRLSNSLSSLLSDYNSIANGNIFINNINPYQSGVSSDILESMTKNNMPGIMLNETDREGKVSRKIIYPYAQIISDKDTLTIPLLKNVEGYTGEENLNASIEGLEYAFTDAIGLLLQQKEKSIAFIEGHGELPRKSLYDAEELLSKYYTVNRGQIGNDIQALNSFDAIIIAGPLRRYTESEKYIIDQYIMSGGKALWLIDGVFYSYQELAATGSSASIKNEHNLDDMLFSYGARINADLIQDRQSASTYVIADDNTQNASVQPNFYQPLLMPSSSHPVTNNIRNVKSGFVSSIDVINNSTEVIKHILLTSSSNAHLVKVPEIIDFEIEHIQNDPNYFNEQFIPAAISLEGKFSSVFTNRLTPDSLNVGEHITINKSKETKMIVVSSSDIITNEIRGQGESSEVLPMGYDRISQTQFGNRDFILNAVNWLTGDDRLMALRTKKQQIYLLDKKRAFEERDKYAVINITLPILSMWLIMSGVYLYRKRRYEK